MNFSFLPKYLPYFNYGALITVVISILVVFFGTILGVLLAFAQRSRFKPLVWFANVYVWIFRGTPMMVQIMIAFALMHIDAPTIQVGILGVDLSRLIPGITLLVFVRKMPCVMSFCHRLSKIFCQHWEMNLLPLSRIVRFCQQSESWNFGMEQRQ